MNRTSYMLGNRMVALIHQGGYLLCVEHDGEKLRLSREELEQVESYIGSLLTSDDLLIDITRLVCQLQNMGRIVTMHLFHRQHFNASSITMYVYDDFRRYESFLYNDIAPPFAKTIAWSDDDLSPLQSLRTSLQKLAVINEQI